jgi:hypothetical protein
MRHAIRLLAPIFLLAACVHEPTPIQNGVTPLNEREYTEVIRKNTSRTNQYSGFYQTFQADMTMLNSEMQTAALRQKGYFLQWDQKQFNAEREKMLQDASAYSKFFMRFYSPERDYDDLHKGKTIWKIYLDVRGQRFEGKVKKMTDKFVEIQTVFPYFDRFSTPYEISFSVPMTTVETVPSKVTLTSTLGTAVFDFQPLK